MIISLLDKSVDTFNTLYSIINDMIGLWNDNDVSNLTTLDKSSLVNSINEVNGKTFPFYEKDSLVKSNISLDIGE